MIDQNGNIIREYIEADKVRRYTIKDFMKPKTFEDLDLLVWVLDHEKRRTDIHDVMTHVRTVINQSNMSETAQDLFEKYQNLISLMRLITMDALEASEVADLLRTHLVRALRREVDLKGYLTMYFHLHPSETADGRNRRKIIQGIRECEETIGQDLITLPDHTKAEQPSVENWLKLYSIAIPKSRHFIENIDVAQFMEENRMVHALEDADRTLLSDVIDLYNYLRSPEDARKVARVYLATKPEEKAIPIAQSGVTVSPTEKRTIEEIKKEMGQKKTVPVAEEKTVPPPTPEPVKTKREGVMSYIEQTQFDQQVVEAEQGLMKTVGSGTLDVRETLETSVSAQKPWMVVALLSILAQTRDMEQLVANDPVFREKLIRKFGQAIEPHFNANTSMPVYLRIYLEYVLQDRLKMSEGDAARAGVRLANILGKKYLKMAFLDMSDGAFSWAPVEETNHTLRLKY